MVRVGTLVKRVKQLWLELGMGEEFYSQLKLLPYGVKSGFDVERN